MNKKIFFISLLFIGLSSCKKFVDVGNPKTLIPASVVYSSDANATAVIYGIYSNLFTSNGWASGGANSVTLFAGLSADEFKNFQTSTSFLAAYTNSLTPLNIPANLWSQPYNVINNTNAVLEGLEKSSAITDAIRKRLTGQAKFLRAFSYFYLVNLFGDVPLILTTDYKANSLAVRAPKAAIYNQIITDLKDAQATLDSDYSFTGGRRVMATKSAATALLARVYLYTGDWKNADEQASAVIANTALYKLEPDLTKVFLANSNEAILQLMPGGTNFNTNEASMFITPVGFTPSFISLSTSLLGAFESADNRRRRWVDSVKVGSVYEYFPSKYKVKGGTTTIEYSIMLRLSEQYLIRAEARAHENLLSDAISDLNAVRSRAGLIGTSATNQTDLINAILQEKRVELFSEWGHRWLDLKRTGTVDNVMPIITPLKGGGSWKSFQQLYPIPQSEILNGINLVQNDGY